MPAVDEPLNPARKYILLPEAAKSRIDFPAWTLTFLPPFVRSAEKLSLGTIPSFFTRLFHSRRLFDGQVNLPRADRRLITNGLRSTIPLITQTIKTILLFPVYIFSGTGMPRSVRPLCIVVTNAFAISIFLSSNSPPIILFCA